MWVLGRICKKFLKESSYGISTRKENFWKQIGRENQRIVNRGNTKEGTAQRMMNG
jgi:hypothetical protein